MLHVRHLRDTGEVVITMTGTGCLLLSTSDVLEKFNKRSGVINHRFKVKCESQRTSLPLCEGTVISCSWKAVQIQGPGLDLI